MAVSKISIQDWFKNQIIKMFKYTSWEVGKGYFPRRVAENINLPIECIEHQVTNADDNGMPVASVLKISFEDVVMEYNIFWKESGKEHKFGKYSVIQEIF